MSLSPSHNCSQYFPEDSPLFGLATEAFTSMDRDGSGSIDAGEFLHAIWIMQQSKEGLKTRLWNGHPSELFDCMDTNGNQRLDLDEWLSYLKGMWEAIGEKKLQSMLRVCIKLMTAAKNGELISDAPKNIDTVIEPTSPQVSKHHHGPKKAQSKKDMKSEEELIHEALMKAAEAGQAAKIRDLLSQDADPNVIDKAFGETPLHVAAAKGKYEAVKALVEGDANLNMVSVVGASALMQSASHGHKKVVSLLLECKADPSVANMMGATAVDVAEQASQTEIAEILKQHGGHSGEKKWDSKPEFDLQVSDEAHLPSQGDLLDLDAFEKSCS